MYRRWQYTTAVATDHCRLRGCHGHRHSPSNDANKSVIQSFNWFLKMDSLNFDLEYKKK